MFLFLPNFPFWDKKLNVLIHKKQIEIIIKHLKMSFDFNLLYTHQINWSTLKLNLFQNYETTNNTKNSLSK